MGLTKVRYLLFGILFAISLYNCKNASPDANSTTTKTAKPSFDPNGIPHEVILDLAARADHIDYLFYGAGVSMNQDGNPAIRQDLAMVSTEAVATLPPGCQPIGRKIYLARGEILMESDLYFSINCMLQVFIKDEVQLYANLLNSQGINFYGNVLEQIRKSHPNK